MKLEQNALQGIADLIVRGPQGSSGRTVTRLEEFFSNCGVGGFEYHPQTTKKLAVRRLLTSINGTEMMEVVLEAMMQPVYFDPTDPVGVPNRQSKFLDELNIWLQSSRVRMTITNDVVTFHRPGESPIAQTGEDMSYWHFSIGLEDGSTAEE